MANRTDRARLSRNAISGNANKAEALLRAHRGGSCASYHRIWCTRLCARFSTEGRTASPHGIDDESAQPKNPRRRRCTEAAPASFPARAAIWSSCANSHRRGGGNAISRSIPTPPRRAAVLDGALPTTIRPSACTCSAMIRTHRRTSSKSMASATRCARSPRTFSRAANSRIFQRSCSRRTAVHRSTL